MKNAMNPSLTTPNADNQKHRDQHGLEENVEQHAVQCHKHTDHQPLQQQESRHVLGHSLLD
jgi:hypothetical protein